MSLKLVNTKNNYILSKDDMQSIVDYFNSNDKEVKLLGIEYFKKMVNLSNSFQKTKAEQLIIGDKFIILGVSVNSATKKRTEVFLDCVVLNVSGNKICYDFEVNSTKRKRVVEEMKTINGLEGFMIEN